MDILGGLFKLIAAIVGFFKPKPAPQPTPEQTAEDHARQATGDAAAAQTSLKDQSAAIEASDQEQQHVEDARAAGAAASADLVQHPDHLRDDDGFEVN